MEPTKTQYVVREVGDVEKVVRDKGTDPLYVASHEKQTGAGKVAVVNQTWVLLLAVRLGQNLWRDNALLGRGRETGEGKLLLEV